jgi:hypothetical protein
MGIGKSLTNKGECLPVGGTERVNLRDSSTFGERERERERESFS